jgi:hypothetical protein
MPADPKESVQQIPLPGGGSVPQKQAMATRRSSAVYMIAWMDFPPTGPFDAKAGLDGARDAAVKSSGGTVISEKNVKLDGKWDGRAVQVRIFTPVSATLYARMYMVKKRFYQLQVIVPTISSAAETSSPDTFFDSFKVMSP